MSEQNRSGALAAGPDGGAGWRVRPHGSVGPRRLGQLATLAPTPGAPVTLVVRPARREVTGNAPPRSPGWSLRVRETPPVAAPAPAPVAIAVPSHPAEAHLAARVVVAAVGATVLVTVVAHLRGSVPGHPAGAPGPITTVPPRPVAPPVARLSAPPPVRPPHTYLVVAGDSMSAIAVRHGITLMDLARANPQVHNLGLIHVGDLLHLS